MTNLQQHTGLLEWFYPGQVLHFHRREEDLNQTIIEGMRTGRHKYVRDPMTSYANLSAEKVTLEQAVEDLCRARLVVFGKDIWSPAAIRAEQDLVKMLVPSLHNRNVMLALPIGDHQTMGKQDCLTIDQALADPRLAPETDAYLRGVVELLKPVISDAIFFPDDKQVLGYRDPIPLLESFRNQGHVYPIERVRTMGDALKDFFAQLNGDDVVYFFGSNLWTMNPFMTDLIPHIQQAVDASSVRAVSQDGSRVSLARRNQDVEPGVYRFTYQPHGFAEYVIVSNPQRAVQVTAPERKDELGDLMTALRTGESIEVFQKRNPSPRTAAVYKSILDLKAQVQHAQTECETTYHETRDQALVDVTAEDIPSLMTAILRNRAPAVKQSADWYNNVVRGEMLEKVLDAVNHPTIPWEQTKDYAEQSYLVAGAEQVLKANEPLLQQGNPLPGIKDIVDSARQIRDGHETARKKHEERRSFAQKVKQRGIQTIGVYARIDKDTFKVLTPFLSADDAVTGELQQEVVSFLRKTAESTFGILKNQTTDGLHELVAHTAVPSATPYAYAQAVVNKQADQPWFKLGYHLNVVAGPWSAAQRMTITPEHLEMAGTPALDTLLDGKYDADIVPRLQLLAQQHQVRIPQSKDEIRKCMQNPDRLHEVTAGLFALTVIELADGSEHGAYAFSRQIAEKHKLDERNVHAFVGRAVAAEQRFPDVFTIRKEGKGYMVKLNPAYRAQIMPGSQAT